MKTIPLTQGQVALVDDSDYDRVNQYKWYASKRDRRFYATHCFRDSGKAKWVHLHTFLMPGVGTIDHEDGNGLNNQRNNLRQASKLQNNRAFKRKPLGSTSGYRGVYLPSGREKWTAQIEVNYKRYYLGTFTAEEDAARAYDNAARKYFGEFASLNFP